MVGSSKLQEPIRAVVTSLCGASINRYAVTQRVDNGKTVTFTLIDAVWNCESDPVVGEEVELEQIYSKVGRGFRANVARRIVA